MGLIAVGLGDETIMIALRTTYTKYNEIPSWVFLIYSVPLTVFITVGACNATNLIDPS